MEATSPLRFRKDCGLRESPFKHPSYDMVVGSALPVTTSRLAAARHCYATLHHGCTTRGKKRFIRTRMKVKHDYWTGRSCCLINGKSLSDTSSVLWTVSFVPRAGIASHEEICCLLIGDTTCCWKGWSHFHGYILGLYESTTYWIRSNYPLSLFGPVLNVLG